MFYWRSSDHKDKVLRGFPLCGSSSLTSRWNHKRSSSPLVMSVALLPEKAWSSVDGVWQRKQSLTVTQRWLMFREADTTLTFLAETSHHAPHDLPSPTVNILQCTPTHWLHFPDQNPENEEPTQLWLQDWPGSSVTFIGSRKEKHVRPKSHKIYGSPLDGRVSWDTRTIQQEIPGTPAGRPRLSRRVFQGHPAGVPRILLKFMCPFLSWGLACGISTQPWYGELRENHFGHLRWPSTFLCQKELSIGRNPVRGRWACCLGI